MWHFSSMIRIHTQEHEYEYEMDRRTGWTMIDFSDKSMRIWISACTSPVDFIDFLFWNIQHSFSSNAGTQQSSLSPSFCVTTENRCKILWRFPYENCSRLLIFLLTSNVYFSTFRSRDDVGERGKKESNLSPITMKRISSETDVIRRASLSPFPDHLFSGGDARRRRKNSFHTVERGKRARTDERCELELANEGKKSGKNGMPSWAAVVVVGERKCNCSQWIFLDMSQDEKQNRERNPTTSPLSLSDVEDQTNLSSSSCFHYISSKQDPAPHQAHSNPQSSFYCVKNTQSSLFLPSTAPVSRPANARTIFTVIAPIPQDAAACSNVREQLAYRSFFFLLRRFILDKVSFSSVREQEEEV